MNATTFHQPLGPCTAGRCERAAEVRVNYQPVDDPGWRVALCLPHWMTLRGR